MSGGVEGWTPIILVKPKFEIPNDSAETEGEDGIDWQTQDLTARLYRGDNANHDWKWIGGDFDSESDAKTAMLTKFARIDGNFKAHLWHIQKRKRFCYLRDNFFCGYLAFLT